MQIEHDREGHRFAVRLDEGDAEVAYVERRGGQVLDLMHTFVPPARRGKGVGEAMVRRAFEYAEENGLEIVPTCPFVNAWLESHPEWRRVVVDA